MSWDFFISFSTKDKDRVSQIVRTMENRGASCWFQLRDSKQDYDKAIINGIRNCNALILFLSPNSAKSTPVKNEVKFAQERADKKILPVILTGDILDEAYDEISMLVAMKNILNVKDYNNDEELIDKIFDQLDFVSPVSQSESLAEEKSISVKAPVKVNKPQAKTDIENLKSHPHILKTKYRNRIGTDEFKDDKTLIDIVIPDGVTNIGRKAFKGCNNLKSIVIPDTVTYIGWYAFEDCSALESITFPSGEILIGYQAFNNTAWLYNQPEGVVYAGKSAYQYKGDMPVHTSITLKDGTSSIAAYAFYDCHNLESITMPDSVLSICSAAFHGCTGLKNIKLSNNLTLIDDLAFSGCVELTDIDIPDSVESIFSSAFLGCSKLTSITLGASITSIESHLFEDCSELTSIKLPCGITSIDEFAFQNCTNLISINIPDGLETICSGAFYGCSALTQITIPTTVTEIGDEAFLGCNEFTSIIIPSAVEYVGSYAFENCDSLNFIYCEATEDEVEDLWAYDWLENCSATVIWGYKQGDGDVNSKA